MFDTHAHYDDEAFAQDLPQTLQACREAGVGRIVDAASTMESVEKVLALCADYPYIYGALGVHPEECAPMTEEFLGTLREKLCGPKIVAVGEIGLDYHWGEPAREVQQRWFIRQLELAQELDLPVVVHSRDAAQDTLQILRAHSPARGGKPCGVLHCYSYGKEMAGDFLELGYYLGVGGVVTYKNGRRLKETVEAVPLHKIVLETDCPYLSPEPLRGRRNSSANLPYVAEAIAALKGVSTEEVVRTTQENALRLYGMEDKMRRTP